MAGGTCGRHIVNLKRHGDLQLTKIEGSAPVGHDHKVDCMCTHALPLESIRSDIYLSLDKRITKLQQLRRFRVIRIKKKEENKITLTTPITSRTKRVKIIKIKTEKKKIRKIKIRRISEAEQKTTEEGDIAGVASSSEIP